MLFLALEFEQRCHSSFRVVGDPVNVPTGLDDNTDYACCLVSQILGELVAQKDKFVAGLFFL